MKRKNLVLRKKLILNKEQVGNLSISQQGEVVGGDSVDTRGACCIQTAGGVNTCFCPQTQNGALTCAVTCMNTIQNCTISG